MSGWCKEEDVVRHDGLEVHGGGCLERMRGCVTATVTPTAALCILSCLMEALVGAMMVTRHWWER